MGSGNCDVLHENATLTLGPGVAALHGFRNGRFCLGRVALERSGLGNAGAHKSCAGRSQWQLKFWIVAPNTGRLFSYFTDKRRCGALVVFFIRLPYHLDLP